jgi:hypothetical protein
VPAAAVAKVDDVSFSKSQLGKQFANDLLLMLLCKCCLARKDNCFLLMLVCGGGGKFLSLSLEVFLQEIEPFCQLQSLHHHTRDMNSESQHRGKDNSPQRGRQGW